jgi:cytidylate kinase
VVIAIDGPSASGKSTVGRMLARRLGLPLVDSGLMYRALTVLASDAGIDPGDAPALSALAQRADIEVNPSADEGVHWEVRAGGVDLGDRVFDPSLTVALTRISQVPGVRDALVARQRTFGERGVVMLGRDIGTVVFPHADVKVFLTASESERRRRRGVQMKASDAGTLKGEIDDRDAADTNRSVAPLRPAEDALTIDTDGRSPASVYEEILRLIPSAGGL